MEKTVINEIKIDNNNSKLPKIYMYILYFFIFSCLGWILFVVFDRLIIITPNLLL